MDAVAGMLDPGRGVADRLHDIAAVLWTTATWRSTPSWVGAGQQAADWADKEFPIPKATHLPWMRRTGWTTWA